MVCNIDESKFVHGRGYRKTILQRNYEKLTKYRDKLSEYIEKLLYAAMTETAIPRQIIQQRL